MENESIEIWKDIPEYNGDYQVSNLGNVKSLKYGKERILKAAINSAGYYCVVLSKNKKPKTINIHILVAMTFLSHKTDGYKTVVDHVDEDRTNNRVENLQLITNRENHVRSLLLNDIYSSKYTGVSYHKRDKNWVSQIQINKKIIKLGLFEDEIEASETYQKALELKDLYDGCNKTFRTLVKSHL